MATFRSGYGYIRVSGLGQVDAGGLDRQKDKILACAKARGIEIVKWFSDEGVSGAKELLDRPALGDLLIACENNGFDVVVIEKLDRLARDLIVQEQIINEIRRRGIALVSADEGDDLLSHDPSRTLVRQIFGAIAEYDRQMIVLKLRAGRERVRRQTGRCEGAKPYGETEYERAVIGYIKHLRRKPRGSAPLGYGTIAARLNEEGVPAKRGGKWGAKAVYNVCLGPAYREARVRHEPPPAIP